MLEEGSVRSTMTVRRSLDTRNTTARYLRGDARISVCSSWQHEGSTATPEAIDGKREGGGAFGYWGRPRPRKNSLVGKVTLESAGRTTDKPYVVAKSLPARRVPGPDGATDARPRRRWEQHLSDYFPWRARGGRGRHLRLRRSSSAGHGLHAEHGACAATPAVPRAHHPGVAHRRGGGAGRLRLRRREPLRPGATRSGRGTERALDAAGGEPIQRAGARGLATAAGGGAIPQAESAGECPGAGGVRCAGQDAAVHVARRGHCGVGRGAHLRAVRRGARGLAGRQRGDAAARGGGVAQTVVAAEGIGGTRASTSFGCAASAEQLKVPAQMSASPGLRPERYWTLMDAPHLYW
eukprot:ctg_1113.g247